MFDCLSSSLCMLFFQEDGGKKIELKPGFLMEHDEDVCTSSLS